MSVKNSNFLILLCTFTFYLLNFELSLAYVASSTNYRLERDSLNFAGALSNSANFSLQDTAGETGTGKLGSSSYGLLAGYQQPKSYISISSPADATLVPSISNVRGGQANGAVTWKVTTDNTGGYTLSVQAASSPALTSGAKHFNDYPPAGSSPDFNWSVGPAEAKFGFSPKGTDLASAYLDNGVACGTGSGQTAFSCWDGFSTVAKTVAKRNSPNDGLGGTDTTIHLRAEAGPTAVQPAGSYSALITATAIAL